MPKILYDTMQNIPGLVTSWTGRGNHPDQPFYNAGDYSTITLARSTVPTGASFMLWNANLSSPFSANAIGIVEHNIEIGAVVRFFIDGAVSDPSFIGEITSPGPHLFTIPTPVTGNTDIGLGVRPKEAPFEGKSASIGSIFLGTVLELPRGATAPYTPPPYGRVTESYPLIGQRGGHFLGSYVKRTGWEFTIEQKNVSPQWVEQNWLPFARHAEHRPFFYLWDDTRPGDCVYAWATKINPPRYSSPTLMEFSMTCQGRHIE